MRARTALLVFGGIFLSAACTTTGTAPADETLPEEQAADESESGEVLASEPEEEKLPQEAPPVLLEAVHIQHGYAMERLLLTTGEVVQMHTGCGEGQGGGEGFWLRSAPANQPAEVVIFDSGTARELKSGHLLVEARRQIGSDMTDEQLPPLPEGARATYQDLTGSIFITRLKLFDVRSARQTPGEWDGFFFATAGEERFVVYAKAAPNVVDIEHPQRIGHEERLAESVKVWDLASGLSQAIVECEGRPAYRFEGAEVFVKMDCRDSTHFFAVHGTSGAVRTVDEGAFERASESDPGAPEQAESDLSLTHSAEGRALLFPPTPFEPEAHPAMVGMCGRGPFVQGDLVFTDEGVFRLPEGVTLQRRD